MPALLLIGASARGQAVSYLTHTLDGAEYRVGQGAPTTLVAVFATWCTSCKQEFATLDSLRGRLAPRGIRILALSVDEASDAVVQRYVTARRTRLSVAHDGSGAVGRTFHVTGVPESVLVDSLGAVRWRGRGAMDPKDAKFLEAVTALR